jgi:hypothetical protein
MGGGQNMGNTGVDIGETEGLKGAAKSGKVGA